MRSSEEIREYFLDLLNSALPRLGMYGEEVVLDYFLSHLAFVDERDAELKAHMETLRTRGAFTSLGVGGAFTQHTHLPATGGEIGSVYAEIAFKMGYLNTDRVLDKNEFATLRSGLRGTCRSQNFNTADVAKEFGVPSWRSGTNPFYPWTYLYLCNDIDMGTIAFDFWNVVYYDEKTRKTCGKFGDLPVLRNIRIRGDNFGREFTFTPIGRKITKLD
jgi:hypothetical protein